jgi:hypothetical protein
MKFKKFKSQLTNAKCNFFVKYEGMSAKTYLVVNWCHQQTHGQWLGPWTVEIEYNPVLVFLYEFSGYYYVFDELDIAYYHLIRSVLPLFKWIVDPWCFTCFKVNVWPNPGLPTNYSLPKIGNARRVKVKEKKEKCGEIQQT